MSDALYRRRIYFAPDSTGTAVVPGVRRRFTLPPTIPGLPAFDAIDFADAMYPPEIQPVDEPRREMFAAEIRAVTLWLADLEAGHLVDHPQGET